MEMKREFLHMVDRMGLEEAELALAEIVWQKAERAMQGKPAQEAILLKQPYVAIKDYQEHDLTRQEVQFLSMILADMLGTAQVNMLKLKSKIQEAWLLCDPEDKTTAENFEYLNHLRSHQRRVSAMMRKFEKIQRKLKKSR